MTDSPDPIENLRDLRRRALSGETLTSTEYRSVLDALRADRLAAAVPTTMAPKAKAPKPAKEPFDLLASMDALLNRPKDESGGTPPP